MAITYIYVDQYYRSICGKQKEKLIGENVKLVIFWIRVNNGTQMTFLTRNIHFKSNY